MNVITEKIKGYAYFVLLLVLGMLTVSESLRITANYTIKDWLSGPSGFMMIVGCAILFLALVEGLSLVKARKAKQPAPPFVTSSDTALPAENRNRLNLVLTYILLIVYALTIKPLGFTISTAIYITLNMLLLKNSWLLTLITVALIIICTMFGAPLMGLSLPRGIFGF